MGMFDFLKRPIPPAPLQQPKSEANVEKKDFGSTDAYSDNVGWTTLLGGPYGQSHTGITVNPVNAMQAGAVYACVRTLVGDIAKLPLRLMRRGPDDIWLEDRKHPLARLLRHPNKRMTQADFTTHIAMSMLLVGNSYNPVIRNRAGEPVEIIPCIPSTVSIREDGDGNLYYLITNRLFKNKMNTFAEEDCIHIRAMSLDGGIRGVSPVQVVSEVLGLAMATQQLAAAMFKNGVNFPGYLATDQRGLSKENIEELSEQWNSRQSGLHNVGRTPVLQGGFSFNAVQSDAEKWQMVEARKLIVEEVARCFGVPLYKLSSNDKTGYSSIDAQQQDYIDSTLIPLTTPIEQQLNKILLFDDDEDNLRFAFDFSALEKGDLKTRSEYVHQMLTDGVLSVNEVRKEFNLPGIGAEGDIRTKPLNTGVLGSNQALPIFQIDAPRQDQVREETVQDNTSSVQDDAPKAI